MKIVGRHDIENVITDVSNSFPVCSYFQSIRLGIILEEIQFLSVLYYIGFIISIMIYYFY